MTDAEFFTPLALDSFEIMDMSSFSRKTQGILLDGEWKRHLKEELGDLIEIPRQGAAFDARRPETDRAADVKLCRKHRQSDYGGSAYVYMSHDEYMFGKAHDTIFVIYWMVGNTARRVATFTFNEAKEAGAIQLFTNGEYVKSSLTGKMEPPWSINILQVSAAYAERLVLE